jgi:hypothetical protein
VRHDDPAAGVVHLGDRVAHRAEHREAPLDAVGQEVALARRDLGPGDHLEPAAAASDQIARLERAADVVVVGDRDHVEVGPVLDVIDDLADRGEAVPDRRVDVQVRFA